jgi:hypothetical protein
MGARHMGFGRFAGVIALGMFMAVAGCDGRDVLGPVDGRVAPPRALDGWYYNGAVTLAWELDAGWDGESFRVYGKRRSDADFFLIAEVTSCSGGRCTYLDRNIVANVTYEYYVAAFDSRTGTETASEHAVEVFVPAPVPPPVPGGPDAIALDDAIYLTWDDRSREAADFSFYRVYLEGGDGSVILLGETDSEGFLDLLVENGNTYGYFVTAVDDLGHESDGSALAEATPRPDFHGEFLYAFEDVPAQSGFRFQESELLDPIVSGTSGERHFRLEVDDDGWWLVPGPGVEIHQQAYFTTALRCGPAADAGCTDLRQAPASDYAPWDMTLIPEHSYVLRVPAEGGGWRYGVIRVTHVGWAQDGAIAIFDWAFQLQIGNPSLDLRPVEPEVRIPGL